MSQDLAVRISDKVRGLIPDLEGRTLIIGVSGGPDSMTLTDSLRRLAQDLSLDLVLAHVEHGFRGEASLADADYVRSYAHKHNLLFELKTVDIPDLIAKGEGSAQDLSRRERLSFFASLCEKYQTPYVLLGQQKNDQLETILMRIIRGTSPAGLSGIRETHQLEGVTLVRPMLEISRKEIEDYCQDQGLEPRQDASNLANDYLRNKIRNQLLPLLEADYNPNIGESLLALRTLASEQAAWMDDQLARVYADLVISPDCAACYQVYKIDRYKFLDLDRPLQRELLLLVLYYLNSSARLEKKHLDICLTWLAEATSGGYLQLPEGLRIGRTRTEISLWQES